MDWFTKPGNNLKGAKITKIAWNLKKTPEEVKEKVDNLNELLKEMEMRQKQSGRYGKVNPGFLPRRFKFETENRKGETYVFTCAVDSFKELIRIIELRESVKFDPNNPPKIMYEDEDGDKIVIASDSDLKEAVDYARETDRKVLKLDWKMNYSKPQSLWASICPAVLGAGGLGILAFLSRHECII